MNYKKCKIKINIGGGEIKNVSVWLKKIDSLSYRFYDFGNYNGICSSDLLLKNKIFCFGD